MTRLSASATSRRREFLIDALHVFVLCSFAVAQPLYDLLGRQAEFFVAHRSKPTDLLLLVLALSFIIPLVLVLVETVAGLFSRTLRKGLHIVLVTVLVTVVFLPVLKKIDALPGMVVVTVAGLLGCVAGVAYIRLRPLRMFLTVLSPAVLIFPVLFLFGSPASKILQPVDEMAAVGFGGRTETAIVMVVFDELSSISLMDENRQIDARRYPNFAALARDSYWFRNATTVVDNTVYALPSMLTGLYPPNKRMMPTVGDYPRNLFTLFASTEVFNVLETVTTLCPNTLCEDTMSASDRLMSLSLDVSIVFLHVVLSTDLGDWLPPVSQGWKDFVADPKSFGDGENWLRQTGAAVEVDRRQLFREFIKSIQNTEKSSIHFLHILLPHAPLMYLPSGKVYPPAPLRGLSGNGNLWKNDQWAVTTAHQRYLLQLQFLDRLIGELTARLKGEGLYEQSLLIVTSDHGISFRVNDSRRELTKTNYPEIMSVPLFVKLPNQDEGHVTDRNVETIDILPSIADVLGLELPWRVDGVSVFEKSLTDRPQKTIIHSEINIKEKYEFSAALDEKYDVLDEYIGRFGTGTTLYGLFKIGPYSDLVGQAVSGSGEIRGSNLAVVLDQAPQFVNIDLASDYLPAYITGHIEPSRELSGPLDLAISINGMIYAVTQTFKKGVDKLSFAAMVPESAFRQGPNIVNVYMIERMQRSGINLIRTRAKTTEQFHLVRNEAGEPMLVSPKGASIPVSQDAVRGRTEFIRVRSPLVTFTGWAADIRNDRPAKRILILTGAEHLYTGSPNQFRPDVAEYLGQSTLRNSGFEISLPLDSLEGLEDKEIRLFALSHGGAATELTYNDESRSVLKQALGVAMEYALANDNGSEQLRRSDGKIIPIQEGRLRSRIDLTTAEGDHLIVSGWVVDIQNSTLPPELVVFANGRFVYSGGVWVVRQDIANLLGGNPGFMHSGFRLGLPLERLGDLDTLDLKIFALLDSGVAEELVYGKGYKYRGTTD